MTFEQFENWLKVIPYLEDCTEEQDEMAFNRFIEDSTEEQETEKEADDDRREDIFTGRT